MKRLSLVPKGTLGLDIRKSVMTVCSAHELPPNTELGVFLAAFWADAYYTSRAIRALISLVYSTSAVATLLDRFPWRFALGATARPDSYTGHFSVWRRHSLKVLDGCPFFSVFLDLPALARLNIGSDPKFDQCLTLACNMLEV